MNGKEYLFRLFYVQRYVFFVIKDEMKTNKNRTKTRKLTLNTAQKRLQASCSKPLFLWIMLLSCHHDFLDVWRKSPSAWAGYIMPPMPGAPPIGISGLSSLASQMTHSVVRNMPAMEAAFSSATRHTLAGSMMPDSRRFS